VPTPPHIPNFAKKSASHRKNVGIIIAIVLAVLLVAGAVVWFVFMRPKPVATTVKPVAVKKEEPKLTAQQASTIEPFKSAKLNVEFNHRKDWKVTESADKTQVVITSPKTSYQTTAGAEASDVFTVKLRYGTIPEAMQDTVQKAIATRDSVVIAYAQPTEQQRQYTNVTDAGAVANTFNFLIVSGSTAYKAGQVLGYGVPLTGQAYMFAGGFGADKDDALAFDPANKSELDSSIYNQALDIIKSLKIF
jgi:flagellar basal body-associated protein FliL